jgi:glucosamine--fructose-6-phosphate aminotransferase (isomerizing)
LTRFASAGNNADAIELVRHRSKGSSGHAVGIAHTRWATHGPKTDLNSHPHIDVSEKIALVHNGTIVNAGDLRRDLLTKGITCQGQTDSEVLAKLIGYYYYTTGQPQDPGEEPQKKTPKTNGTDLKDAIAKALNQCDGTWGLCVMCADQPDELIVACNGSPLVIGIDDDRTYVASETSAFNHYVSLQDANERSTMWMDNSLTPAVFSSFLLS